MASSTQALAIRNAADNIVAVSTQNPVPTSGTGYAATASKTRPADTTAYAAGDVIAESASAGTVWTFANIGPTAGRILITSVSLQIAVAALPAGIGAFRVHLYDASPTAINDNAAFDLPSGDRAKYLGFVEVGAPEDLGSTLWAQNDDVRKQIKLAVSSTTLYGVVETRAAFTPTSAAVKSVAIRAIRLE
jgi:hypothetical protein